MRTLACFIVSALIATGCGKHRDVRVEGLVISVSTRNFGEHQCVAVVPALTGQTVDFSLLDAAKYDSLGVTVEKMRRGLDGTLDIRLRLRGLGGERPILLERVPLEVGAMTVIPRDPPISISVIPTGKVAEVYRDCTYPVGP